MKADLLSFSIQNYTIYPVSTRRNISTSPLLLCIFHFKPHILTNISFSKNLFWLNFETAGTSRVELNFNIKTDINYCTFAFIWLQCDWRFWFLMSHIVFPPCSRERLLTQSISSEICNRIQPDSGGFWSASQSLSLSLSIWYLVSAFSLRVTNRESSYQQ